MGSTTILDIIGSFVVGGLLLLTCLQLKAGANENSFIYNSSVNLQLNLVTLTSRMEDDFRKIAYSAGGEIKPGSAAVEIASASSFKFMGDIDNDGKIDSLEWGKGNPDYTTPNPRDFTIYRKVWKGGGAGAFTLTTDSIHVGATQFQFRYKTEDSDSSILVTPVNLSKYRVGIIDIAISLEAAARLYIDSTKLLSQDTAMYTVYWRQFRVVGKNLAYR
jgi:hypothetical protein